MCEGSQPHDSAGSPHERQRHAGTAVRWIPGIATLTRATRRAARCPSTSAIRPIAPRRHQQRHVQMPFRLSDREPDRDAIEEGRIGQRHLLRRKIRSGAEIQLILSDRQRAAMDQRLIGAAVRVGDGARDHAVFAERAQLDQSNRNPGSRLAAVGIEHMGRQPAIDGQALAARDLLIEAKRRDPADLLERAFDFLRGIVRQPALEVAQNRILGVAPHADDIGKAELVAIGGVDPLEGRVFGLRQPIQARAVLFGAGIGGEPGRALGLVGEIGVRLDQRHAPVGRGLLDDTGHCGKKLRDACEWPLVGGGFRDPRRMFEDIGEISDEIRFGFCVQVVEVDRLHESNPQDNDGAAAARSPW